MLSAFKTVTTVAFIDDDEIFLESMKDYFSLNSDLQVKTYNDPQKAIYDIKKNSIDRVVFDNITSETHDSFSNKSIRYEVQNILKLLNKEYARNIVIAISDYAMPVMNGEQFCRNIDKSVYKILLTGSADENHAVNLFNEGIIDFYTKKDCEALSILSKTIEEKQYSFYTQISNDFIRKILLIESNSVLDKDEYYTIFMKYIRKYKIEEFCLIDEIGSYYMRSRQSDYILYITEESKNIALVEHMKEILIDENILDDQNQQLLAKIQKGECLIADHMIYNRDVDFKNIHKYTIKSRSIVINHKQYYYFFSKNNIMYNDSNVKLFNIKE